MSAAARYDDDPVALAARVRAACVRTAIEAYEDAGVRGLCDEGRWEYAVDAIRRLDLAALLRPRTDPSADPKP